MIWLGRASLKDNCWCLLRSINYFLKMLNSNNQTSISKIALKNSLFRLLINLYKIQGLPVGNSLIQKLLASSSSTFWIVFSTKLKIHWNKNALRKMISMKQCFRNARKTFFGQMYCWQQFGDSVQCFLKRTKKLLKKFLCLLSASSISICHHQQQLRQLEADQGSHFSIFISTQTPFNGNYYKRI